MSKHRAGAHSRRDILTVLPRPRSQQRSRRDRSRIARRFNAGNRSAAPCGRVPAGRLNARARSLGSDNTAPIARKRVDSGQQNVIGSTFSRPCGTARASHIRSTGVETPAYSRAVPPGRRRCAAGAPGFSPPVREPPVREPLVRAAGASRWCENLFSHPPWRESLPAAQAGWEFCESRCERGISHQQSTFEEQTALTSATTAPRAPSGPPSRPRPARTCVRACRAPAPELRPRGLCPSRPGSPCGPGG